MKTKAATMAMAAAPPAATHSHRARDGGGAAGAVTDGVDGAGMGAAEAPDPVRERTAADAGTPAVDIGAGQGVDGRVRYVVGCD
jgi:hypothetical protein